MSRKPDPVIARDVYQVDADPPSLHGAELHIQVRVTEGPLAFRHRDIWVLLVQDDLQRVLDNTDARAMLRQALALYDSQAG